MTDWQEVSFLDVCDIEGGTQPPKDTFRYEPTEGYVRMLQIQDFKTDEKPVYIPQKTRMKTCTEEDVLIARYGASLGRILKGKAGAYNVALVKTIPDLDLIDRSFLFQLLSGIRFQRFLANVGSRAAQAGFNKGDLKRFRFPLPPLDEQKRIAEVLDRAEALRARRRAALALLDELTQSIFLDMFGDPVTNPKDWPTVKIGEVCETTQGVQIAKADQLTEPTVGYKRYLYIKDFYSDDTQIFVKDQYPAKEVTINDLVMNNTGNSSGRVSRGKPGILSNNLFKVSFDNQRVRPDFLFHFLSSTAFQLLLWEQMKSGTQPHLGHAMIKRQTLPIPSAKLQREFESRLAKLREVVSIHTESLALLNSLFSVLQSKAFRGELSSEVAV